MKAVRLCRPKRMYEFQLCQHSVDFGQQKTTNTNRQRLLLACDNVLRLLLIADAVQMLYDLHVCLSASAQLLTKLTIKLKQKVHDHAAMRVALPNAVLLTSSVLLWMQKLPSLYVVLHTHSFMH